MHSVTDKTYGTEYNCNRWLSRAWPPRVCKHFVCCLRTNCKKYKSTILQTCTFWIEFPDQLRRTRLKNIILFYFIKYEEIGNKNGVFFTFSPIKRLIFTQKGTFDFEVFSHIHVLRSMFFVKPPHFSNPNSQKRHHSFVTTHPPLDIIIFIIYLLFNYVFMSSGLVSFQRVYGRAELLTVRTIVASSADVLGLDMFVQSGFVFGCPAAGETVPPLLCPHHAARYYVFYFHVSCNTRHNKQRSKFGIINFNQVRGPTASLLVYI